MAGTWPSRSMGSILGQGAKILYASRPKNQNIKQKQYCNKFHKDFLNGLYCFLIFLKINSLLSFETIIIIEIKT